MSNCEEYMWLHQRYAHALTSWIRTSNSPDTADDKAATQERDATFRALSDHAIHCRHCNSVPDWTGCGETKFFEGDGLQAVH